MHLSSAEAVLTGTATSGLVSLAVALTVQRMTTRRDHTARLWMRKAETYEDVLSEAETIEHARSKAMGYMMQRDYTASELPYPNAELLRMRGRLALFGESRVSEAYNCYTEAALTQFFNEFFYWLDWHKEYHKAAKKRTVPSEVDKAEQERLFDAVWVAHESALKAHADLVSTVREEIRALPVHKRQ